MFGSCLIMWNVLLAGQLWLVMCTILSIMKSWPWLFVICNLRRLKLNDLCGQSLMKRCWSMSFQNPISRDSWLITHKLIGTLSKLFMVLGTSLLRWLIRSTHVYFIGVIHLINTANNWLDMNCKMGTRFFATCTRMPNHLGMLTIIMFSFVFGGFHLGLLLR